MSYPSGQVLMARVTEDESLPIDIRVRAVKDASYRPAISSLLRLIRNASTPRRLRAEAVIRYNQLIAVREAIRNARRTQRSKAAEEAA
jgi:hypothetical protein